MADDNIPVKDTSNNAFRSSGLAAMDQKAAQQRSLVSKWSRDELEDKYLRLHEENLLLRKHARKQEDKIKRMATKLLRLVSDRKKQDAEGKGLRISSVEAEEKILELQDRLQRMEKINVQLKDRLLLIKQQALTVNGTKRVSPYPYIQSRINTGIPKHQTSVLDTRISKNIRVMGPPMHSESAKRLSSPPPGVGQHLGYGFMEESKAEKRQLQNNIAALTEQLNLYEMEIENLKEQSRLREAEYEEDLIRLKTQMTTEQRQIVQENIDLIKLQRQVKEKSAQLLALQDKYAAVEGSLQLLRQNNNQVLVEMERQNFQLKEEQNRVLTLQNELRISAAHQKRTTELQEQVVDLQKEIDQLKEANENLVRSAFDLERETEWKKREKALKVQIAQLEATLKSDLGEKGSVIDKYVNEQDAHEKLQHEYRELQINHFALKEQFDDMQEKLHFFTKGSGVDLTELEDALVLVKQKKQKTQSPPDFLQKVDEELDGDHKRQLLMLQADYAETVLELEKTRNMLVLQHKINKDYQKETEMANQQLEETKKEYELKLDEYARLLDIRAARIKKLESQLHDVAYGTRQYRIPPADDDVESSMDLEETLQLERGQNLFEIHVQKVSLSEDAVRHIGDEEPSLFCTWEFFEFETQSTPVMQGSRPVFDFTSQYIVRVDDFFLHYLQKQTCTLELHQSFGQDFRTVAACQLVFRDIFDKSAGRIHGLATLTGVSDGETGVGYGTVEYWIRLRVPMEQALRLYKERTKALGYLTANERHTKEALTALDEEAARRPLDNVNELHIKIIKCSKLKARRTDVQPSPYCVYQFFDFSDHDTVIVRNSNNPEFHDHKTYPVPMATELDQYLSMAHLKIFVFDDADPEEASYIGQAEIPLMTLRHMKELKGTYPLMHQSADNSDAQPDREQSLGTIDVEIYWQHEYIIPRRRKHTPLEMDGAPEDTPVKLPASPRGQHTPARPTLKSRMGPSATSTPLDKDMMADIESQIIQPKPKARRQVLLMDGMAKDPVHDTVSEVVKDYMRPGLSESTSADMSTIQSEKELKVRGELSDRKQKAHQGLMVEAEPYSTEEEELQARPAPPRSSLNIESESGSEEGGGEATFFNMPMPTARKHTKPITGQMVKKRGQKQRALPPSSPPFQTMEEDEESVKEEIEEDIEEEVSSTPPLVPAHAVVASETESEPAQIESDSEGVVMFNRQSKHKSKMTSSEDSVTVIVSHLSLETNSNIMKNPDIKKLFVEYRFLGLAPEETETPYSLPKPGPYQSITFNFSKNIQVDMKRNYGRRQLLAAMLLPDDPEKGRIRFTVVSEPDDQDRDCEDVGVAYVSLSDILKNKEDVIEQDIDILDPKDESQVVGRLNVTIRCLVALQAVEQEMQVDSTY